MYGFIWGVFEPGQPPKLAHVLEQNTYMIALHLYCSFNIIFHTLSLHPTKIINHHK